VHGGGWDAGDAAQLSLLNYKMEQWGVAVFSLEYKLAPQSKWPAPLEDTYNAITWIKQHASELNVNFEKGFLLGRSAGGQIALSACYSQKVKEIKGCIAFYAPTDMEIAYKKSSPDDFFRPIPRITAVMGASPEEKPQVYKEASALQNVNASSVPTLLLHGTPDFWVWFGHSLNLYNKLQGLGVPSALIEFPWATHGFDVNLAGPSGQLSTDAVEWFLLSELEKK
jgi:acetyl esterase/lipase